MAKIEKGILGAVSGKVGPVVGFVRYGRAVIRSCSPMAYNPRTPRQQGGRAVFGVLSKLAKGMSPALAPGLGGLAAAAGMTARNMFVGLNRQCVSVVAGAGGDVSDAGFTAEVDYASLQVSAGSVPPVQFGTVERAGGRLSAPFGPDGQRPGGAWSDYVYLFAYAPRCHQGLLSAPALRCGENADRCEGRVELPLPPEFDAEVLQLYGFVWDRRASASPTMWLGASAPEDAG